MQYLRAVWRFLGFPQREGEEIHSVEGLDRSMVWYMDHAAYEHKARPRARI